MRNSATVTAMGAANITPNNPTRPDDFAAFFGNQGISNPKPKGQLMSCKNE